MVYFTRKNWLSMAHDHIAKCGHCYCIILYHICVFIHIAWCYMLIIIWLCSSLPHSEAPSRWLQTQCRCSQHEQSRHSWISHAFKFICNILDHTLQRLQSCWIVPMLMSALWRFDVLSKKPGHLGHLEMTFEDIPHQKCFKSWVEHASNPWRIYTTTKYIEVYKIVWAVFTLCDIVMLRACMCFSFTFSLNLSFKFHLAWPSEAPPPLSLRHGMHTPWCFAKQSTCLVLSSLLLSSMTSARCSSITLAATVEHGDAGLIVRLYSMIYI